MRRCTNCDNSVARRAPIGRLLLGELHLDCVEVQAELTAAWPRLSSPRSGHLRNIHSWTAVLV
jgi:hypothetical protein